MRGILVLAGLVPLALAACGSDSPQADAPTPKGDARIRVVQTIDPSGGLYTEGSYSYVRVETPTGADVADQRLPDRYPRASAVVRVPPGDYRLVSYQRPCDGNCGHLDAPADRCATTVHVAKGRPLRVSVVVTPGHGCTARVARD